MQNCVAEWVWWVDVINELSKIYCRKHGGLDIINNRIGGFLVFQVLLETEVSRLTSYPS